MSSEFRFLCHNIEALHEIDLQVYGAGEKKLVHFQEKPISYGLLNILSNDNLISAQAKQICTCLLQMALL